MRYIIIDDDHDLLEMFAAVVKQMVGDKEVVAVESWDKYIPASGDTVIHDLTGVGNKKEAPEIRYISCSGSITAIVDLYKPFSQDQLRSVLFPGDAAV